MEKAHLTMGLTPFALPPKSTALGLVADDNHFSAYDMRAGETASFGIVSAALGFGNGIHVMGLYRRSIPCVCCAVPAP
jgi:hypothetical protein